MHARHRTESYRLVTHHCCQRSTQSVDALDGVEPARDAEAEPDESAKVGVQEGDAASGADELGLCGA
jgi:hypothetical protein